MKRPFNQILKILTRSVGFYQILFLVLVIVIGLLMATGIIDVNYTNPYNYGR